MEQLLLFCCKGCLKGEGDNREYYELLGIDDPKRASTESIKQAYKKRSLQMHPDKLAQRGIEVTEDHSAQFQKMKEAYDVLSDPRKRRLYDEVGLSGLKLVESPSEVNPAELIKNFQKNRSDRAKIAIVVALIFAIILLEPILFCLKCDHTIDSPWLAIWAPIWAVDFIILASAALHIADKYEPPTEEGEEPEQQVPMHLKLLNGLESCLFVLIQIFILMRLDKRVLWSWFIAFIPWFAWEVLGNLHRAQEVFLTVPQPQAPIASLDEDVNMQRVMQENEYYEKLISQAGERKSMLVSLLRCWLAIFLALQLDGFVQWNWGLVFLPIWTFFIVQFASAYYMRSWGLSMLRDIDLEAIVASGREVDPIIMIKIQHGQELAATGAATVIFQLAPIFISILLVVRLQGGEYSTFIILLPIYLAIFCCLCGVGCGLCCLSNIDTEALDRTKQGDVGGAGGEPKYTPPSYAPGNTASRDEEMGKTNSNGNSGNGSEGRKVYGTFKPEEDKSPPVITTYYAPPSPSSTTTSTTIAFSETTINTNVNSPFSLLPPAPPTLVVSPPPSESARIDVDID